MTISDYKTSGVGGSFERNNAFYTLVRTRGTSAKENVHAGGSFGIGKNSAFAASIFRTVFYSSRFKSSSSGGDFYCMGKSVLRSWEDDDAIGDDKGRQKTIYWGNDEQYYDPVVDENDIPEWLRRDEQGLSIHVIGLHHQFDENWNIDFLATLIKNFYVAISQGAIEFSLGGKEKLNKSSIDRELNNVLANYEARGIKDRDLENVFHFLEALRKPSREEIINIKNAGTFRLQILVNEDLKSLRKIHIVRNGMLITDNLKDFAYRADQFINFRETNCFSAILQPAETEDKSSDWLKKLEGPSHNLLTTTYLTNKEEKKVVEKEMEQLTGKVRKIINEVATSKTGSSDKLDELDAFVKQQSERPQDSEEEEKLTDPTKTKFTIKKSVRKKDPSVYQKGGKAGGTPRNQHKDGKRRKRKPAGPGNAIGQFKGVSGETKVLKLDAMKPNIRTLKSKKFSEAGEIRVQLFRKGRDGADERIAIKKVLNGFDESNTEYLAKSIAKGDELNCVIEIEKDFLNLYAVSVFKADGVSGDEK